MPIFPTGALLQIHISDLIENEDMNGAMEEVIPMHFRAACVAADSVVLIDHREPLVRASSRSPGTEAARCNSQGRSIAAMIIPPLVRSDRCSDSSRARSSRERIPAAIS